MQQQHGLYYISFLSQFQENMTLFKCFSFKVQAALISLSKRGRQSSQRSTICPSNGEMNVKKILEFISVVFKLNTD